MESNSYPYTPLRGDEIRYLSIHPFNEFVGVVQCTLHQAPLHDVAGKLTALSYAWGDASVTQSIQLTGHSFEVTTNLAACLRQFATNPEEQQRCLWVDAICINQQSVDERNIQVCRMKEIYSTADSVIAWLGPATHLSHIAMQWLQNINPSEIKDMIQKQDGRRIKGMWKNIFQDDRVESLRDIVQRPYWCRTWIIQEIVLGQRVRLLCGDDEVVLEKLIAVNSLIEEYTSYVFSGGRENFVPGLYVLALQMVRDNVRDILSFDHKSSRSILDLVYVFEESQCSDARDKAYGLLGICSQSKAEGIIPDYNRPIAKVYGDLVEAHIRSHDDIKILGHIYFSNDRDKSFPSWVRDWRVQRTFHTLYNLPYAATNNMRLSSHPWSLDRNTETLDLTGACLDIISTLGTAMSWNIGPGERDKVDEDAIDCMRLVYQTLTFRPSETGFTSRFLKGIDVPMYSLIDNQPLDQACRRTLVKGWGNDQHGIVQYSEQSSFMMLLPGEEKRERQDGSIYTYKDTGRSCMAATNGRRMAITSRGWIGLVPEAAEVGDHVALLTGANTPFILRNSQIGDSPDPNERLGKTARTGEEFLAIGNAYIHGLMHGRGMELAEPTKITLM